MNRRSSDGSFRSQSFSSAVPVSPSPNTQGDCLYTTKSSERSSDLHYSSQEPRELRVEFAIAVAGLVHSYIHAKLHIFQI